MKTTKQDLKDALETFSESVMNDFEQNDSDILNMEEVESLQDYPSLFNRTFEAGQYTDKKEYQKVIAQILDFNRTLKSF